MDKPLVSVIITSYKKFEGIYYTLDSIFAQTYSNIEIIINDDGSPNYAEYCKVIEEYIAANKRENITNVIMNHLEQNVGTSRNCNAAIALASGKYVKLLPPDDELYNEKVLERCVEYAEVNDARILIGQTFVRRRTGEDTDIVQEKMMYRLRARGGRLCNVTPSTHDIRRLQSMKHTKRNALLMSRCIISTISVFFRMDLLRETGGFLEDYRLIEDMTYWPYIAKQGEHFFFSDIIMVKYALNGVSNGGPLNKEFFRDYATIMKEIYIASEVRGGIFNKAFKRLRIRQIDWMKISLESSRRRKIRYLDVIIYQFIRDIKYLMIGTKL